MIYLISMPQLKKSANQQLFNFKSESWWITAALQNFISIKNALFKRYIKLKSPVKKKEVHQQYNYEISYDKRNLLSTLIKKAKQIVMNGSLKIT